MCGARRIDDERTESAFPTTVIIALGGLGWTSTPKERVPTRNAAETPTEHALSLAMLVARSWCATMSELGNRGLLLVCDSLDADEAEGGSVSFWMPGST